MSIETKTPATTKRVTKAIRLTSEEAEELAHLVRGTAYAEAALMRQWVLQGMQQFRVSEAVRAYQEGQLDLRQAAERAGLPVAVAVLRDEMAAGRWQCWRALTSSVPG